MWRDRRRTNRDVVFSVIDTGEGIAEDQLASIFAPYWQAKADRKGIGLGLSVAKIIVCDLRDIVDGLMGRAMLRQMKHVT